MVIKLKIDPEFENLIPPSDEYEALENSILDNGYDKTCPIRVWKGHNIIVDGHNRYRVCKEHGIVDFTTLEMEFENREAVRDWMYREQLTRRNLDKLQRTYFMGMVYKAEKLPNGTNQHTMPEKEGGGKSATLNKESTAERIGKLFHVSSDTVKEAEKFANAINKYAKNADVPPYPLLSTFSNEIKTTQTEIIDVSNNFSSKDQKEAYNLIKEKKADSLTKAMIILGKSRQKIEGTKDDGDTETEKEPKQPQKNEHGVYSLIPKSSLYVKVQEEDLYDSNGELHCVVIIGQKECDCLTKPVTGEENNFYFELPNVRYLIMDYSAIFPSMFPIIIDSTDEINFTDEKKAINFVKNFPDDEWNMFVEPRFPQLVIQKQETVENEVQPEQNSQTVDEAVKETVNEMDAKNSQTVGTKPPQQPQQENEQVTSKESDDTEREIDKSFILYVGKRDMGVIEEFNNHELELAAQCHAIKKEQDVTELWDNKKHRLIFAFEGKWKPEDIITIAGEKISVYLDAEEPTIPEKEPQGTTQIPPINPKLFENTYAVHINKILEFAFEKQLKIVDILAGIGLDKSNKTEHKGITLLCKELDENKLMRVTGGNNKRLYTALVRSIAEGSKEAKAPSKKKKNNIDINQQSNDDAASNAK